MEEVERYIYGLMCIMFYGKVIYNNGLIYLRKTTEDKKECC